MTTYTVDAQRGSMPEPTHRFTCKREAMTQGARTARALGRGAIVIVSTAEHEIARWYDGKRVLVFGR